MRRLLIDTSNILNVSMHRGKDPDALEVDGESVNTWEYGYSNFLDYLKTVLDDLGFAPRQVILVLDAKDSRSRRQRIHPGYKAHRTPKSKEFYAELATLSKQVQRFIRHLGGTVLSATRFEADDVIAHLAGTLDEPVILSTDTDLIFQGAHNYIAKAEAHTNDCGEKYLPGLNRKYIPLYRALVGDPKDFGPGISAQGFGEKAFLKHWLAVGDEGLDLDIAELNGDMERLPTAMLKSPEELQIAWKLAQWIPVPYYLLKWQPGFAHGKDCETYDEAYDAWYQTETLVTNINTRFTNKLRKEAEAAPFISLDIETDVPEESLGWLKNIKENFSKPAIQVDVHASELCGLSVTVGDNLQETYYFPVDHKDTDNVSSEELKDLILSLNNDFLAHNAGGFELPVLYNNWGTWVPNMFCSQIAAGYVDENDWKGLKHLSKRYFHYKQDSYQSVVGNRSMRDVTGEQVLHYGCDDTIMAGHLMCHFLTVMENEGSLDAYTDVEQNPMYMVASSFVNGVDCDLKVLEDLEKKDREMHDENYAKLAEYLTGIDHPTVISPELSEFTAKEIKRTYEIYHGKKLDTRVRKLEKVLEVCPPGRFRDALEASVKNDNPKTLNRLMVAECKTTVDFKVNSPKQVPDLMYNIWKLPVQFHNKLTDKQQQRGMTQGNPAGDEDSLKWAMKHDCDAEQKEVLQWILNCKAYLTRNGLFYSAYRHLTHWKDGKLRPGLKQSATTSRRFAPAGPNVNQLPKRKEDGKKVRRAIVPHHKDAVIVSPDFSSQELRLAAEASQDPAFLSCYLGDDLRDLHTITGFAIDQKQDCRFNSYEDFDAGVVAGAKGAKKSRALGKNTNFLSNYGGSAPTLSKALQISEELAQEMLDAKSEAFPVLEQWKEDFITSCGKKQLSTTYLGGVKHLHELIKKGGGNHIMRSALNFRIQSSGAEMTKLAIGNVWAKGLLDQYDVRFLFAVHDELCFSIAKKDLTSFCKELRSIMEAPYAGLTVPFKSTLSVGFNFGELDEIKWEDTEAWLRRQ